MKKHLFYFLIIFFSIQNLNAQCDNVTSPGSIAADQVVCADNPDPFIISNVELPSGGSGDLEFLWISAMVDPNSSTVVWTPIPDSPEDSYDPGPISYTTYYRRCSRRAGCSEYIGESNIITVEYAEECMDACEFFKVNVMAITPADCGLDNGMVNLSIVAGTLPLSYNLNGETIAELPELYAAGSYDLTVTDADGCTDNVSFIVEGVENTVSAVGDIINPICQSSNGSIDLTISGGTGAYTIIWNDGSTDIDRANLSAGTYTVTVSDENSCSTQESFSLTVSDSDLAFSLNPTDASCDSSNGSAEVIIEGGMAPYVIELDGNIVTEISNLSPGSYIVSVTDANGCTEEEELMITGGSSNLTISATLTNPICTANNGSIDLNINGATGPLAITWNFNDSEDATQENLAAGAYEVTVTDENGCTASESFTLTAEESNLDINIIVLNANCGGTGSAGVEVSNGTAPYSILINGEAFTNDNELAPGDYIVNVTDANGCEEEATFTIIEAESDLTITGSTLNPSCSNNTGAITLTITGGTGIVSVLWEDGNTDIARIGLAAGTYSVTATDENACSISESFILTAQESNLSININTTDALCGGTGSANIEVSNGIEPYSITINGDNTLDTNALTPGDYSVNVIDADGCEIESSFTIEGGESDISISGSTINPICSNNSGAISLVITGGTGAISVIWEDGNTETERTDLAAGTYNATAIDENGCTISESFILTAEESDLSISVNTTDAVCGGTGSASFEVSNGTEPFSFVINGDNALDASALVPGDYSVNATDANGCEAETSFSIESTDSDISISGSTINPVCSNNSGAISLVITGGTGNYSVIWEDGNTEIERTDLAAGTYNVSVTDENACTATESFVLTTMDSNLDLSLSLTDVSCNGGDDGAATLEIFGGTEPYTVTLDGIEVTEISNLSAGEYMVTVVDAEGCSVSLPFSIAQPALLMVDANIQNATCGGDNGSIELILSGGTGNYTVVWDDNLSNDLIRTDLAMGTYSVSVKDENDCIVTTQFTLTGGDNNLETVLSITNISCNGAADGSVSPTVNNGTPPYLFVLNNAVVLDLDNLAAGDYSLETTDLTGCSVTEEFTITEPSTINVAGTIVNESCGGSNGNITLDITGGTPNEFDDYIIFWSSGNGMNLSAGNYTVTVTDSNGCVKETSFTLSNEEVDLDISISTTATSCSDTEDGTANVNVSGGTEPYSYILNGEAITELPVGYAAGDYSLTVTEAGGCSTESSFSIAAQSAIELSVMVTNAGCAGSGEITLAITGGTEPYDYLWSNDVTSQNLSDVTAGDYFVTVTDANGCTAVNAEAYSVGNDSATFTISTSTTPVSCFGGMDGTVTVSVDGGQEPYSYALDGMSLDGLPTNLAAGDYILSVQDANGCSNETTFSIAQSDAEISYLSSIEYTICGSDFGSISLTPEGGIFPYEFLWSNGEESQNLVNVTIGSYTVTITDANGCSVDNDDSPFLVIGSPNVALNSTVTSTSCGENNGSIAITVSQGTPPYQIVWNDGLMDDVLRSDLSSGNYGVTITDANNCSISEEFSLASSIDFVVSITPISASCNGTDDGQINMSFAGGTPPFTYILNGQSLDDLPSTLPSDDYQLQVFDAFGCSDLVEFSVGEPDEIVYLAEQTDANCPDEFVTVEFATVQGGSGAYTYLWSDGVTTLNRDDLTSGTYFLTITDTNGCTAISEAFVADVPSHILISADEGDFQNVSCFGETDGSVDITVTGGTPPYSYYWSNGATTEDIDNLAPGDYLLQLTDANGCMTLFLAVISNPQILSASSIVVDASCMMEDGSASIWPLGGTQPYFFLWENGSTSAEEFNLAPGIYKVTVSDFGSCEVAIDIEVGEMDCLQSETGEEFNFVMNELNLDLTSHSVEIHWMTEAEANESFFIIQHSMDGDVFTDIGGLLPGQGATQSQNEYFNTCVDMAYGTHFFRIRYVDVMGNLRTSETMNVEIIPENKLEFSIFPNPTMDVFRVNFLIPLDAPANVQIISAQAGILENVTAPIGTLHQRIDLRKYNPGVYFVVIEREGLRRLTKRIVKM